MDETRIEEKIGTDDYQELVDSKESKADRFKRLASKRVNAAIKQLELIGNLSSGAYEYTEDQVEKIFGTLQRSLDTSREMFSKTKQTKEAFSFDD